MIDITDFRGLSRRQIKIKIVQCKNESGKASIINYLGVLLHSNRNLSLNRSPRDDTLLQNKPAYLPTAVSYTRKLFMRLGPEISKYFCSHFSLSEVNLLTRFQCQMF
jgi:hypothetical protein